MRFARKFLFPALLLLVINAKSAVAQVEDAAQGFVPSRIVAPIDEHKLVKLTGNTHPMARGEFDKGLVDSNRLLERMVLVLQRSPEQEQELAAFNKRQYDPKSADFHHWLHASEFGRLYGPSDADITAITSWLQNSGFAIDLVSKGRVSIEFTGTVAQVQDAFHVEMHRYEVKGVEHIANDRDASIPEALAPVVRGIASLHDFFPKHQSVLGRYVKRDARTGKVSPVEGISYSDINLKSSGPRPQYSFPDPNVGDVTNEDIAPYDFAAMYNLTPLWKAGITGKGVSIAIAAETDINLTDVATFRKFFGLSGFTGTAKLVINGTDPGTVQGAVTENTLDAEWAGASAPDANVLVVVTGGTATSFGGLLSIEYIIDNETASIMSGSYGTCEAGLGSAANANLNSIYQQGSTEGISLFESAGDQGSTGCDNSDATSFPAPAQYGLQVNGFVSSPYITGVGGTDIVWQEDPYSTYWTANTANNSSAIGYIPEIPWNSTCTSSYLLKYVYTGESSSEQLCNDAYNAGLDQLISVVGGSGGKSSCLNYSGNLATCSGAYAKPSWQKGTGVPSDGVRDVPDVSLFASAGLPDGNGGSAYLICVSSNSPDSKCDYTGEDIVYQEVGGTSVSSPAMAGIMALVVQKTGASQGLANPVFYELAAKENLSSCNSNTVANGNSCVFYDVTTGTNAMPCLTGSLNCVTNTSGDNFGIVTGYTTTSGYDLATGLGSVNAYNLVNAWPTTTSGSVTISPTSFTFPSTTVNTTSSTKATITVNNGTSSAVSFTSVSFSGTNASSYSDITTCPTGSTLAASASCTVTVSFKPTATGTLTATLNVVDGAGTQTAALTGTGAAASAPAVSLSPTSLTFPATNIGSTPGYQKVTLTNTGTATLDITSIAVTGTNGSSFGIRDQSCGSILAASANCTFSIAFTPKSAGTLTAAVSVTDNATGSPQKVTLTGTGKSTSATTVSLSPTTLTFPATYVGSTPGYQKVTLTNTGTATLSITSFAVTGTDSTSFGIRDQACGSTLAASANCTFSVAFTPKTTGTLTAAISITDNATGSPQQVTLSGTGKSTTAAPVVSLSPTSLTFAATTVGSTAGYQAVTLTNTGNATLDLTSFAVTGTNTSSFGIREQTCGSTLAAGANCTFRVAFSPKATGTLTAAISVTDNATGSPQKVTLTGTGK